LVPRVERERVPVIWGHSQATDHDQRRALLVGHKDAGAGVNERVHADEGQERAHHPKARVTAILARISFVRVVEREAAVESSALFFLRREG